MTDRAGQIETRPGSILSMLRGRSRRSITRSLVPYLLVFPVLIYFIVFWARPVAQQFINSFRDTAGNFTLSNYQLIISDPAFWPAFRNTAAIVLISVTLEFALALGLALLINRKWRGAGVFLFVAMIPMALPPVAVAAMWKTGFTTNGWINSLLTHVGILEAGDRIYWLAGSELKMLGLIILIDAWQVVASVMIILLAGLQNIPRETEEAGYVFGGNYWTVLRKITLPLLAPTIQTAVLLRLIAAIQIWLIVIIMVDFSRLPVLVERIVYYHKQVPRLPTSPAMAAGYSVVVALIVSVAALFYLRASGAFRRRGREAE